MKPIVTLADPLQRVYQTDDPTEHAYSAGAEMMRVHHICQLCYAAMESHGPLQQYTTAFATLGQAVMFLATERGSRFTPHVLRLSEL